MNNSNKISIDPFLRKILLGQPNFSSFIKTFFVVYIILLQFYTSAPYCRIDEWGNFPRPTRNEGPRMLSYFISTDTFYLEFLEETANTEFSSWHALFLLSRNSFLISSTRKSLKAIICSTMRTHFIL